MSAVIMMFTWYMVPTMGKQAAATRIPASTGTYTRRSVASRCRNPALASVPPSSCLRPTWRLLRR
jgi:hypothetical protein